MWRGGRGIQVIRNQLNYFLKVCQIRKAEKDAYSKNAIRKILKTEAIRKLINEEFPTEYCEEKVCVPSQDGFQKIASGMQMI